MQVSHRPDQSSGAFDAVLRADGILHISIRGMWTMADVDTFFDRLAPVHAATARLHVSVRALIEMDSLQPPAVAMKLRERTLALKRPSDRNAFVLSSALHKLQVKRLASTDELGVFTDRQAAERWLAA